MSKLEKILVISLTFVVAVFINFNFIYCNFFNKANQ